MRNEKIIPLVKGAVKHIPRVKSLLGTATGGTSGSRYCYSIWMRHLQHLSRVEKGVPRVVAELGPGDSLGIGLSALLTGSSRLIALDVVRYWNPERNLRLLDELIELITARARIPDNREFPRVFPEIDSYDFPAGSISESKLRESLEPERIACIRRELMYPDNAGNSMISVFVPWSGEHVIKRDSVDLIYSQAVLEHIDDLRGTFHAMRVWLKAGGLMSHSIDFASHGITPSWNGHWTFSDLEWWIARGGRRFLINRNPCSTYLRLHEENRFAVVEQIRRGMKNDLPRERLARRFRELTDKDLSTSGMYIVSRKIPDAKLGAELEAGNHAEPS